MFEGASHYDVSNTMFSPEGRLFQVEYAREAIKKGGTVLAMKYLHGVVFITQRPKDSHVTIESSAKKLFRIGDSIGAASSGLMADARVLVDYCRFITTRMRLRYDEPISIEILVKRLSNVLRDYTQYGGVRPFGVAFFIGGIDSKGIHLYETDISGSLRGYKAGALGKDAKMATELLEERYRTVDTSDEAVKELLDVLKKSSTAEKENVIEVMVIDESDGFSFSKIKDVD